MTSSPLYPFGYGLSYTTFAFSNLRLEKSTIRRAGEPQGSWWTCKIPGRGPGQEVVQMYIHDCVSSVTRPVKELKGIHEGLAAARRNKTVALPILPEHLAFTTITMKNAVEAGDFEIMVGNSSGR